jgi:NAD+ synthase (glutamine-hydrolysing)
VPLVTVLRVALAQVNLVVGDLAGNVSRMQRSLAEATATGADLVAFPELAVSSYPPEDLVLKRRFVEDNRRALDDLAAATGSCAAVVGFVDQDEAGLYNAAAVCADGMVKGVYRKRLLPNYAVFDEERYFETGVGDPPLFEIGGVAVGVAICEDAWEDRGPLRPMSEAGAGLVVVINGSPYHDGKVERRERIIGVQVAAASTPLAHVNLVGGQDELVFDGESALYGPDGTVTARARPFAEDLLVADVETVDRPVTGPVIAVTGPAPARESLPPAPAPTRLDRLEEIWQALVLGTHDYVTKNGFSEAVIGLSGGVDSSIVAALAVDALGPGNVHGVLMPSRYSSDHSLSDARALSENLGIEHRLIPIEAAHVAFTELLADSFSATEPDLTEENVQSRIRGLLLMALSNKFGWLVLTTGNKSESAVGYSTLYGDTAGGYAVIKDVPKLLVYDLCRHHNTRAGRELIPEHILTKPPSAELRPDQRDDQSLPPYEELDPILEAYVEHDRTAAEIAADGHDPEVVARITRLVDIAEHKRRQSPPGPRITSKAFGKDRRLPITNRYRGYHPGG